MASADAAAAAAAVAVAVSAQTLGVLCNRYPLNPHELPCRIAVQCRRRRPPFGPHIAAALVSNSPSGDGGDEQQQSRANGPEGTAAYSYFEVNHPPFRRPLSSSDNTGDSVLRVAYQGCPGAYSEAAAAKAYPNCQTVPCEFFETAFDAVEGWVADRAVLPIENTLGGSIHRNYDLLLRHNLHIVGEVRHAVRHCLLANHGITIDKLKKVISHPQALAQCEHTLAKLGVEHREAADDTAGAAKYVATHHLKDTGAVASSMAAELYGLEILAEDIQDDPDNVTRFLMLAREPIIPRTDKPFKTSIVFSLEEGPGKLFQALGAFAMRNINLTKIESRPHKSRPLRLKNDIVSSAPSGPRYFDYLFYVDFDASMADPVAQNALGNLKEFATFLRILGSYPADLSEA